MLIFASFFVEHSPPEAVCGKPSQDLLQTIIATYKLDPSRTCMVGTSCSAVSDVMSDLTCLAFSRLVLVGCHIGG